MNYHNCRLVINCIDIVLLPIEAFLVGKVTFYIVSSTGFAKVKPAIDVAKQAIGHSKPTIDKSEQLISILKPMIGDLKPALDKLKQVSKNLKPTIEN